VIWAERARACTRHQKQKLLAENQFSLSRPFIEAV